MLKINERNTVKNARTISMITRYGFDRAVTDTPEFGRWVQEIGDAAAAKEIESLAKLLGHLSFLLFNGGWNENEPLVFSMSPDIEGFKELDLRSNGYAKTFAELFWSDAEDADVTEVLSALIESADVFELFQAYSPDEYPDPNEDYDGSMRVPSSFELVVHIDMDTRKEIPFGIAIGNCRIAVYR